MTMHVVKSAPAAGAPPTATPAASPSPSPAAPITASPQANPSTSMAGGGDVSGMVGGGAGMGGAGFGGAGMGGGMDGMLSPEMMQMAMSVEWSVVAQAWAE